MIPKWLWFKKKFSLQFQLTNRSQSREFWMCWRRVSWFFLEGNSTMNCSNQVLRVQMMCQWCELYWSRELIGCGEDHGYGKNTHGRLQRSDGKKWGLNRRWNKVTSISCWRNSPEQMCHYWGLVSGCEFCSVEIGDKVEEIQFWCHWELRQSSRCPCIGVWL